MSRGSLPISRSADEFESSDSLSPWMKNLVRERSAVEVARDRQVKQESIHSQIQSYMNGSKRFATVEDAVTDLRQRTGLDEYLKKIKAEQGKQNKKTAAEIVKMIQESSDIPETLKQFNCAEQIVEFIKNKIMSKHGFVSIPEIQHDIIETFSPKICHITEQHLNEDDVLNFISKCIFDEKSKTGPQQVSNNLGKGTQLDVLDGNEDYFSGLNPAKD